MATIKCPNCGVYNTNKDYCEHCDAVLSYKIRRELALKIEKEERLKQEVFKSKKTCFFRKIFESSVFISAFRR